MWPENASSLSGLVLLVVWTWAWLTVQFWRNPRAKVWGERVGWAGWLLYVAYLWATYPDVPWIYFALTVIVGAGMVRG